MTINRRPPDAKGPAGRAWLIPNRSKVPDHSASLAQWLVNCPGAHPAWQWWTVGVVHLRPIEGVKPTAKQYPEAEYEFLIYAVSPEDNPEPDPDHPEQGYTPLFPLDVVEQFHGISDRDAVRLCGMCIRAIVDGLLSPDQDYRAAWKKTIEDTVAHYRAGKHPEN
jgi:hypothetical protein